MKVTIGLVLAHGFPVPVPFLTAWSRLLQYLFTGAGNQVWPVAITRSRILESYGFPTDVARNDLCRMFLDKDDGDALLFLDADMVMPEDIAHRLASHGLPLVSGRYDMRKPPHHSVAMRKTGPGAREYDAISKLGPQSGLMPIDAAGAGSLLIRREVLQTLRERVGDFWFQYQVSDKGLRDISEDMWFFEQAKAAGIQAWIDTDCYSKHIAQVEIGPEYQRAYLESWRHAQASA